MLKLRGSQSLPQPVEKLQHDVAYEVVPEPTVASTNFLCTHQRHACKPLNIHSSVLCTSNRILDVFPIRTREHKVKVRVKVRILDTAPPRETPHQKRSGTARHGVFSRDLTVFTCTQCFLYSSRGGGSLGYGPGLTRYGEYA